MAITKKQKELDELKWLKSEELGQDACGTFDYCAACDKTLENPCDKAYRKTHTKPKVKKRQKGRSGQSTGGTGGGTGRAEEARRQKGSDQEDCRQRNRQKITAGCLHHRKNSCLYTAAGSEYCGTCR